MRSDHMESGFTLLEVIVALVIAALALAGLYGGAATGLRSSHLSGNHQAAISLARSHLEALGHDGPLVPGTRAGDDGGGFHWRLRVAPLGSISMPQAATTGATAGPPPRLALFAVAVTVSWSMDGGTRQVALDTQRIGALAPAAP